MSLVHVIEDRVIEQIPEIRELKEKLPKMTYEELEEGLSESSKEGDRRVMTVKFGEYLKEVRRRLSLYKTKRKKNENECKLINTEEEYRAYLNLNNRFLYLVDKFDLGIKI